MQQNKMNDTQLNQIMLATTTLIEGSGTMNTKNAYGILDHITINDIKKYLQFKETGRIKDAI